jgi:hypothetical protein
MTDTSQATSALRRFLAIFAAGLGATFFLPVRLDAREGDWGHIIALLAIGLALQFGVDFFSVGTQGEFAWTGVADVLFVLPVVLLAAWAAARIAGRADRVPQLMTVFLSVALVFFMISQALRGVLAYQWPLTVWYALACGIAGARMLAPSRGRGIGALLATVLCIGVPIVVVNPAPVVWSAPLEQGEDEGAKRAVSEEALYLQPSLLERELTAVEPGQKGAPELFVLVVAGDASQDVFMKEADYVASQFEESFGAQGHIVTLINNPQSAKDTPMASVTSMQHTLDYFAQVMDPAKDILFLYLTSHGSPDHKFSLQFGGVQFNDLDPPRLREMLDKSGIRRRVIVVSACYSGGFVEALKSEDTLVITAAAADRTSFGCSNEADFTYFGKAYFEEALHKTTSFTKAFELAKASIAKREQQEKVEPSKPQIFVGAHIEAVLDEFEKGREARKPGST